MSHEAVMQFVKAWDALLVAGLLVRLVWPWDWRGRDKDAA